MLGAPEALNEGLLFLVRMMMSFHCIEAFSSRIPGGWRLPGEPEFCWVLYLGQGFTCPPAREKLPIAAVSSEGPKGAPCASPLCWPGVRGAERGRGQADGVLDTPSLNEAESPGKLFGRPRGILPPPPAQPSSSLDPGGSGRPGLEGTAHFTQTGWHRSVFWPSWCVASAGTARTPVPGLLKGWTPELCEGSALH